MRLFAVLLVTAGSTLAHATEVSGLYEAEVPIVDRSPQARAPGIKQAFALVLVKVTGDRRLPHQSPGQRIIRQASQLVQQYRYRPAPASAEPSSAEEPEWLLWTRFDAAAVERLLAEQGLPVWGKTRPVALLWLAIETSGRRELVGSESRPELVAALQQEAASRGVPVLLPLLDLEDRSRLHSRDVWADSSPALVAASARYTPDVVVVARAVRPRERIWMVRWSLYHGPDSERWEGTAADLAATLGEGLQRAIDVIAERFVPAGGAGSEVAVEIRVSQIRSPADYARATVYLAELNGVERVEPVRVEQASVRYRLRVRGGIGSLRQSIGLGGVLLPSQETIPRSMPAAPTNATDAVLTGALDDPNAAIAPVLSYRLAP